MRDGLNKIYFLVTIFLCVVISGSVNRYLGYNEGQRDALRGIYRIDQAERDYLDPEGARHHLARPE